MSLDDERAAVREALRDGAHLSRWPHPYDAVICLYEDELGRPLHRTVRSPGEPVRYERWTGYRWEKGLEAMVPVLYRLGEVTRARWEEPVFIVEDEEEADRLGDLGMTATTWVKGAEGWRGSYLLPLAGRHLVLIPGKAWDTRAVRAICRPLKRQAGSLRVLWLPVRGEEGRIREWVEQGGDRAGLFALARATPEWEDGSGARLAVRELSEVATEPVRWLWQPYIPRGKLTLIDGDPGVGKSLLALAIAAAVTRGEALPGDEPSDPGGVLLLCGEDGAEDTIKPRLLRLGAYAGRVRLVTGVVREDGEGDTMTLSREGVRLLEQEVAAYRPALVVIDPLVAFLEDRVDMHRANEVRSILRPVAELAQRHGTAVLALRHLTKAPGSHALYRGQGSIDFAAAARSVLLVVKDPGDGGRRLMLPTKASLTELGPGLAFRVADGGEIGFAWEGSVEVTAEEVLGGPGAMVARTGLEEAMAFLREVLADGPEPVRVVYHEAKEVGISERTLDRAKAVLRVRSVRRQDGAGACWEWELVQGCHGTLDQGAISGAETGTGARVPRVPQFVLKGLEEEG